MLVAMQKHQATLSAFQFRRATADLIQVYNEDSYLMAEYSERTGNVSWHRVLLATQREIIHQRLRERYPVQGQASARREPPAPAAQPKRAAAAAPLAKVAPKAQPKVAAKTPHRDHVRAVVARPAKATGRQKSRAR
jgi:hypothetical protein